MKKDILRVIDANLNRAREGLRVCEEVARFVLNSSALTKDLKNLRHRVHHIYKLFPKKWKTVVVARDSAADVGKSPSAVEMKRRDTDEIFFANMQRTKESVRVLEEFLKLYNHRLSGRFKRLRFDLYEIEKKVLERL